MDELSRGAIVAGADQACGETAAACVDRADVGARADGHAGGMEPGDHQPLVTALAVASAALLMVRAGLAKKRLHWRREPRWRRQWRPWRR